MFGRTRSAAATWLTAFVVVAATGCAAGSPLAPQDGDRSGAARVEDWDPIEVPEVAPCDVLERMTDPTASPSDDGLSAVRLQCLTPGPDIVLAQLQGRPVLVNVWASWCGPCREEMPLLTAAHREFGDRVQFVGVNTADVPPAAAGFLEDFDVRYPQLADPESVLLAGLRIPGLPVTLVLDSDGTVLEKHIGPFEGKKLGELLTSLMEN